MIKNDTTNNDNHAEKSLNDNDHVDDDDDHDEDEDEDDDDDDDDGGDDDDDDDDGDDNGDDGDDGEYAHVGKRAFDRGPQNTPQWYSRRMVVLKASSVVKKHTSLETCWCWCGKKCSLRTTWQWPLSGPKHHSHRRWA